MEAASMKGGPVGDRDRDRGETASDRDRASMKGGPVGDRDQGIAATRLLQRASMKGGPVGDRDRGPGGAWRRTAGLNEWQERGGPRLGCALREVPRAQPQ